MKTFMAKKDSVNKSWHLIDADGVALGRLAVTAATILMGKHRPEYTPHVDTGDFVIVTNAERVLMTGKKAESKVYRHHTGYIGHLREIPLSKVMLKKPEMVVEMAVRRMLPKTKLGRAMYKKLKVYAGPDHPHEAQCPKPWKGVIGRGVAPAGGEA